MPKERIRVSHVIYHVDPLGFMLRKKNPQSGKVTHFKFPRGRSVGAETPEQTAKRIFMEQTGLRPRRLEELTRFTVKRKGRVEDTTVFVAQHATGYPEAGVGMEEVAFYHPKRGVRGVKVSKTSRELIKKYKKSRSNR